MGSGFFYGMALGHDTQPLLEALWSRSVMSDIKRERPSEMRLIKHPYKAGIKAQRGVEF